MSVSKSCEREECDNPIPPERLKKHPQQRFCCQKCAQLVLAEERKASDFYARFSKFGNQAQNALAEKLGERPGRAKRSASLTKHNLEHPRVGKHKYSPRRKKV